MTDRFDDAPNMAIFCDFENVAIGVRDAKYDEFDIDLVLERLLDKGKIVVKKAYADWERYKSAKRAMHEASFEMIEIPHVSYSGKNSADIRLVVDALDLCYVKQHVDVFVIVSGDSDFSPLVSKLRENNKRVIGLGVKNSSSDLLIENCDEFIYYDDLVRARRDAKAKQKSARPAKPAPSQAPRVSAPPAQAAPATAATSTSSTTSSDHGEKTPEQRQLEAMEMVLEIVEALFTDREGALWGSMVKQTMKRKRPNFSERFHGYRTFNDLLEDAVRRGLLDAHFDEKSGGYLITAFGPNA
ncbi:NYN domain-containing protein [Sandaracinus amylolyticus]|uniref:NYN domain-containing protein n=1 Tax=Sandaracinus amylolyticus TaxID=927083 RepID=UPI001F41D8FF|nr:NYN domain-containing protein [Sandaracinus amylolyticus]UJR79429.1 HTH OST-type domain-containing protein [Sandaracinus amylolyticus]